MFKRSPFGRLLMWACSVVVGVGLAASLFTPSAVPSTQPVTAISAMPVQIPSGGLRIAASNAMEVPKYSVFQDVYPQWCEHTAASITTRLSDGVCFITIELSPTTYSAIYFHSEGDLVMEKPAADAKEITFSVTVGTTKFWLDVNNPQSPLYTKERANLWPNCEPGYTGAVTSQPLVATLTLTGGCLAGQPAAFA